MRWHPLKYTIV